MGLWSHVLKAVAAAIAIAAVFAFATYWGVTVVAVMDWLKSVVHYFEANVQLPHWGVWIWTAFTVAVIVRAIVRALTDSPATPRGAYRGDVILGLRWQWDLSTGDVLRLRMFCAKCYHEFRDADFKGELTDSGPAWRLICENCSHEVAVPQGHELYRKVKAQAERRARTDDWKGAKRRLDKGV